MTITLVRTTTEGTLVPYSLTQWAKKFNEANTLAPPKVKK
jgi:hypothetical protein